MSNFQYWSSLWITIIVFFVLICLLYLGSGLFVFLCEHIRGFQIWNSPLWPKLKIPVIIIGVAAFIAAIAAFSRFHEKRELKLAMEYAESQGWKFSKDDADGLKSVAENLSDYYLTSLRYIRIVESGQRSVILFDCSYKRKDAAAGLRFSPATACMVRSNRFPTGIKPVEVFAGRNWTEVMISDKVDMETSPFAERFLVISKDPSIARALINTEIQNVMLQHLNQPLNHGVSVNIGPGGALMLGEPTFEHEELDDLIDLACRIEEAIR